LNPVDTPLDHLDRRRDFEPGVFWRVCEPLQCSRNVDRGVIVAGEQLLEGLRGLRCRLDQ